MIPVIKIYNAIVLMWQKSILIKKAVMVICKFIKTFSWTSGKSKLILPPSNAVGFINNGFRYPCFFIALFRSFTLIVFCRSKFNLLQ
jgi:hypothetical protein